MNPSNPWFLVAFGGVVILYHLNWVVSMLNLAQFGKPLPSTLSQLYTEEKRERCQDYHRQTTHLDLAQDTWHLALLITFWLSGGFEWLHAWTSSFGWHPVATGTFVLALTSLANRRLFDERLGILARQAHRETQYLALVLVDVDHFKRFNDQYGHPAGDAALQAVAEVLQGVATRPLDLAARLGGEEMALLLYGANAEAAQRLGLEALGRLRQLGISHQGSSTGRLSMCLGVSLLRPGESTESLYQRVDRLLYEAKEGGRDRMVFAA
jgi:diguanylate cyclase (GGDEF)-like protein